MEKNAPQQNNKVDVPKYYSEEDINQFLSFFNTDAFFLAVNCFESEIVNLTSFNMDRLEAEVKAGNLPWHSLHIIRDYNQRNGYLQITRLYNLAIKYWEYKGFNDEETFSLN